VRPGRWARGCVRYERIWLTISTGRASSLLRGFEHGRSVVFLKSLRRRLYAERAEYGSGGTRFSSSSISWSSIVGIFSATIEDEWARARASKGLERTVNTKKQKPKKQLLGGLRDTIRILYLARDEKATSRMPAAQRRTRKRAFGHAE
jgi:hypothetical protein